MFLKNYILYLKSRINNFKYKKNEVKDMRVITGTAKAKSLQTLEGKEIRPTSERVKEAVFSATQFEIVGRRF